MSMLRGEGGGRRVSLRITHQVCFVVSVLGDDLQGAKNLRDDRVEVFVFNGFADRHEDGGGVERAVPVRDGVACTPL